MTTYRAVTGIAWDDEPEYFEKVSVKLSQTSPFVALTITSSLDEFRGWIGDTIYDFALVDIFDLNRPIHGEAAPEGLDLSGMLRNKHPDMPLILATDLFDTIERESVGKWELGTATYIWSKSQREGWFASNLFQLLEERGLIVETNSLLVLGQLSKSNRANIEKRLDPYGISITFEQPFDPGETWEDIEVRIRKFAGFLVIPAAGEVDRSMLDIGRIMSMPRGKERLIVACKTGQFPWLQNQRARDGSGVTAFISANGEVGDDVINRIRLLMK